MIAVISMDETRTIDPESSKEIRATDNSLKDGDLQASQEPEPLKLGADGLPVGWGVRNGNA